MQIEPVQTAEEPAPVKEKAPENDSAEKAMQAENLIPEEAPKPAPEQVETVPDNGLTVVIDPGHQEKGNSATEPVGPGAAEKKAKVTGGTAGRFTGIPEYELNLAVSLLIQAQLERRGYRVILTRQSSAVDISNAERAQIANDIQADAFVRIHANGSEDTNTRGVMTICMTQNNPYNAQLYASSRLLSDSILEAVTAATGAEREKVWETDTMTGINWSQVPVTILEMGYMTNQQEDNLLSTPTYRESIAKGVADGIDSYFSQLPFLKYKTLENSLQAELDSLSSKWDVWVENLSDGGSVHCTRNIEPNEQMVSASLIKLFIMGAVFDRIRAGELEEQSLWGSLSAMITVSDNEAANQLTKLLGDGDSKAGREAVTRWAASIGCRSVVHNRLMLESNGTENYVTASDCASLLRMIYRGECVSPEASEKMLHLLKAQQVNDRIPAGLPEGTVCAHKTGNLNLLCVGDVGIVFAPRTDYILCAICNCPVTDIGAADEIVALSKTVYAFLDENIEG